jgi:hypothetical protein
LPTENPDASRSTTKADSRRLFRSSGSDSANTRKRPPTEPFVMNCLRPRITQSPPSSTAVVCSAVASEPALGSVRQKHGTSPPSSTRASASSRKPSFAILAIGTSASIEFESRSEIDADALASSS